MRKLGLVLSILAVFSAFLLFALARPTQAASVNGTGLPQEADYCVLQFPPVAGASPGQTVQVIGQVFEAGVTEAPGQGPGIAADVGIGPAGSDPRNEVDWTFTPAVYQQDVGNNDEYAGDITAPFAVDPMEYAYVVRFSTDGTQDFTYCDLDGAGSNEGSGFDANALGVLSVQGTGGGGGGGSSEGSVNTSVDVISDPGACIILDSSAVNYGQETFSTPNSAQLGLAQMTVTSCSLTTSLDLLAKGTNATGPTAAWALTDPPGSGNMCGTGGGGIDEYGQRVQTNDGQQGTELALTNRTYMTGLAQGVSQPTDILLRMPCIGSSGTGETVSSTITFTAIPGAPPPAGNVCADPIPFLDIGTSAADNTDCQSIPEELTSSCVNPPGAGHNQYFAFELQDGETATVIVDAPWEPVVALYAIDPFTNGVQEADCGVGFGQATVSGQNNFGQPAFYVVQIDGVTPNDFGPYDITLSITPGGVDADLDGFTVAGGDCDDTNAGINPAATELANGIDDNCNGLVDEDVIDADADGFTAATGDCDDTNPGINPAATEFANGIDDNCNGVVDEGLVDADADGFTVAGGDCDDANASINPAAAEIPGNGIDEDCDGVIDG